MIFEKVCALGREVYLDIWGKLLSSSETHIGWDVSSAIAVCSTCRALCASKLVLSSRLWRSEVSKAEDAAGKATRRLLCFLSLVICLLFFSLDTEAFKSSFWGHAVGSALVASLADRRVISGFTGVGCALTGDFLTGSFLRIWNCLVECCNRVVGAYD